MIDYFRFTGVHMALEPLQLQLSSLEVPSTLLKLSISLYPPGCWRSAGKVSKDVELWNIRKTIADWSLRALANFKDTRE